MRLAAGERERECGASESGEGRKLLKCLKSGEGGRGRGQTRLLPELAGWLAWLATRSQSSRYTYVLKRRARERKAWNALREADG